MIILPNLFIEKPKIFIRIANNKKNYYLMEFSSNDNIPSKIFNIVKKQLNINELSLFLSL